MRARLPNSPHGGGYYLPGKGLDGLAREVAGYVETGLRAVKIKVGRVSGREDAARVEAVRKAVGPDVEVMADANNAWTQLQVKDGGLALPQEPGLGVVLDAAAVERFSKDGWR